MSLPKLDLRKYHHVVAFSGNIMKDAGSGLFNNSLMRSDTEVRFLAPATFMLIPFLDSLAEQSALISRAPVSRIANPVIGQRVKMKRLFTYPILPCVKPPLPETAICMISQVCTRLASSLLTNVQLNSSF